MNKRTHGYKVKMARKMRKRIEISKRLVFMDKDGNPTRSTHANIFDSEGWIVRKALIADRVKRHQAEAHARALARKAKKHAESVH